MMAQSLLSLPNEVLDNVLDHALPIRKLAPYALADAEWSRTCDEGRELPALLFVSKVLSDKVIRIFYRRSILECPIAQLPRFIFNGMERPGRSFDLASSHRSCFRPRPHLSLIRDVHLYSDQRDVIVGEGYEATLGFLVRNTAVERITLCSRRTMARIRRFPIDLDALVNLTKRKPDAKQLRKVYVYSKHPRCQYEIQHMSTLAKRAGGQPPHVQTYLMQEEQAGDPILDPRWDTRGSVHWLRPDEIARVCEFISTLNSEDERVQESLRRPESGQDFSDQVYAVIYVLKGPQSVGHDDEMDQSAANCAS